MREADSLGNPVGSGCRCAPPQRPLGTGRFRPCTCPLTWELRQTPTNPDSGVFRPRGVDRETTGKDRDRSRGDLNLQRRHELPVSPGIQINRTARCEMRVEPHTAQRWRGAAFAQFGGGLIVAGASRIGLRRRLSIDDAWIRARRTVFGLPIRRQGLARAGSGAALAGSDAQV